MYVFSNDNQGRNSRMPLNKFKFDSIQGNSNIHCDIYRILNAFLLNLTFTQKSPTESPQTHGDSSQSPYPSHTHTHGNPHGNPHTHGSPRWCRRTVLCGVCKSKRQLLIRDILTAVEHLKKFLFKIMRLVKCLGTWLWHDCSTLPRFRARLEWRIALPERLSFGPKRLSVLSDV